MHAQPALAIHQQGLAAQHHALFPAYVSPSTTACTKHQALQASLHKDLLASGSCLQDLHICTCSFLYNLHNLTQLHLYTPALSTYTPAILHTYIYTPYTPTHLPYTTSHLHLHPYTHMVRTFPKMGLSIHARSCTPAMLHITPVYLQACSPTHPHTHTIAFTMQQLYNLMHMHTCDQRMHAHTPKISMRPLYTPEASACNLFTTTWGANHLTRSARMECTCGVQTCDPLRFHALQAHQIHRPCSVD